MKKILIISPHFPPSNLAGVHRSRLLAQHLPEFGWNPIILTVDEKYYEEALDPNLSKLVSPYLKIEKVKAFKITKPRFIGDIGLRAFIQLYKKAKNIIKDDNIDFLYIPVPSFYVALLGRMLSVRTNIKYGIDYIDPWVHKFPGSNITFSRHWWSTKIASVLEGFAVKKASLISGVAAGYYEGVKSRNPKLLKTAIFAAMPYGGEILDHKGIENLNIKTYLLKENNNKIRLIYAGAMLPKAYLPLEMVFGSIKKNIELFENVEFYFIGTGKTANDPEGYNVKPLAEKYGLWNKIVYEYPKRVPYLDVLVHLNAADAIFILGSTEPHYTPSKVYQAVLAKKPIYAILHQDSSAVEVLLKSKAGIVLSFNGERDIERIRDEFSIKFKEFNEFIQSFDSSLVVMNEFEQYSARAITAKLAEILNSIFDSK